MNGTLVALSRWTMETGCTERDVAALCQLGRGLRRERAEKPLMSVP